MRKLSVIFLVFSMNGLFSSVFAGLDFLGEIVSAEPQFDVIVVKGNPTDAISLGQVFEIVFGDEVYGKTKVIFKTEDGFEGKVIDGSTQELFEIINGKSDTIGGFGKLYVLESEEPQQAIVILKSGTIRHLNILEQQMEGISAVDEKGNQIALAFGDIQTFYYQEEDKYHDFVKKETLVVDVLPGFKEREEARVNEIKKKNSFDQSIRLFKVSFSSKNYAKALEHANEALKLFPNSYLAHFSAGQALVELERADEAILALEKSLKLQAQANLKKEELADIQYFTSKAYLIKNRIKEAKKYLESAFDNGRNDIATTNLLVEIELRSGRFDEALNTILYALKNFSNLDNTAKFNLQLQAGKLYFDKHHNLDTALKYLNEAKKIRSDDKETNSYINKILLEKSKIVDKDNTDIGRLGGAWRTSDNSLYISFFEEALMLVFFREDPVSKKLHVILIGGDFDQSNQDNIITIKDAKTQKFQMPKKSELKFSQVKRLSDSFFSGEEEVKEIDSEVNFKVLGFTPLKLDIILDGTRFSLVPMDTLE